MKLQVKENSEESLLDPTFPNVMEDSIKNICPATTASNHSNSYIDGDEDSNVSSY